MVATLWMPVLQIYGSSMSPTLEAGQDVYKRQVSSKEQKKINMDLTAVKDFFERVQTQAFAENIQEAMKLLTKASSIIFVGVGNSSIIGKYGACLLYTSRCV